MATSVRQLKTAASMSALVVVAVLSGCGGKDAKDKSVPATDTVAAAVVTDTTFTDTRDGKTYTKVTIGTQVWMAENLNYDVPNVKTDVCYDNKADNCKEHGRLYDWKTALKACPAGWHLPSDSEWDVLMVAVGGVKDENDFWQGAGKKLKSTSGWNEGGNGTDAHGFSALPGGNGYSDGSFYDAGSYGYWWSATENGASHAWGRYMYYGSEIVDRYYGVESRLFSVRCAQD